MKTERNGIFKTKAYYLAAVLGNKAQPCRRVQEMKGTAPCAAEPLDVRAATGIIATLLPKKREADEDGVH